MSPSSHVGALTPDVCLETEPLRKCLRSSEVIMGFPGGASGKEPGQMFSWNQGILYI